MADCKQNINRHLNSAQQWLSQAEQDFDKNRDIRGELNLFLAQAELTHAREVNRSQHWRYKYPALRHGLAFGLALAVAVGGMGVSYWWGVSRHNVQPTPQAAQLAPLAETSVKQASSVAGSINPATEPMAPAQPVAGRPAAAHTEPAVYQQPVRHSRLPEPSEQPKSSSTADQSKDVPLTTDEINKLIRSAGKSLRGQ
ncbi:hypothetical protein [Sporomusa carbonis]|uniref:hypothetical protein n=1 Tax=Sporomusa carbonis TaxID=3076075 RepID=UPI003C7C7393